jgi:hypothetical protein
MSARRAASRSGSVARRAARLFGEFAGFAVLLFIARFVARGHLVPQLDQECHIGGIAIDVLAHGIRFPLLVYAPNEYDNGSFFSGLLAAASFALLGRNVLALKLVTLLIAAAGAVATLWLLRGCLDELGLTSRRVRWTATSALVIAIALAPVVVTMLSMYAVGNHTEGSAIDTILLALFSRRRQERTAAGTAAFWALVAGAVYVNKGTFLVIPVLLAAEVILARRAPGHIAAAVGGFIVGATPELIVVAQRHGMGWLTIASKAEHNSQAFPRAFIDSLLTVGEHRPELLAAWALALVAGTAWFVQAAVRRRAGHSAFRVNRNASPAGVPPPVTLGIVAGVSWLHLAELSLMAKSGLDQYVIYGYPTIVVLFAVLVAMICAHAAGVWGETAANAIAVAALAITVALYRPDAITWGFGKVAALWGNHAGAACSWRFAEGFERAQQYGLAPPGQTREQYAIERCRSLSGDAQVLDCIGGIARELNWRQNGRVAGEPPAGLSAPERRAYAYLYGTHRKGDSSACRDFESPDLVADCSAAVQLECLVFADIYTRMASAHGLGRPRCTVPEPPMDGYWAAMRRELLARSAGTGPSLAGARGDDDLQACQAVFDACY